jgi:hypothetical protein
MPNFLRLLRDQVDPAKSVLPITQSTLDAFKIEDDIKDVDTGEAVIHKVRRLRNKIVAHRDMSIVVRDALHEMPQLPDAEIEELIGRLYQMIDKYCSTLGLSPIVLNFPGQDDYEALFKLLRKALAHD